MAVATQRVTPARRAAFAVIRRVFEQGAYADRAFHREAKDLDTRERAFAMQLAFGTVQRKASLDHMIEQLARPAAELDAVTLAALRLGLYQLAFLDAGGAHAVVGESVELAKGGHGGGHKLVNAVLRRASRDLPRLPFDDTPPGAAIAHSYPEWLVHLWWQSFGADETRALLRRGNEAAEVALRANALVTTRDALSAALPVATHEAEEELPEGLVVDGPFDAHGHELWREGAYATQSRAAMLVGRTLDPQPGERVLDLCAAPGGKTTHLSALMQAEGEIVAVERHEGRAAALQRTCERMRATNVTVKIEDTSQFTTHRPLRPRPRRPPVQRPRHAPRPPRPALAHLAGVDRADGARPGADHAGRRRSAETRRPARLLDLHAVAARERAGGCRKRPAVRVCTPRAAPPRSHRRLLHRPADRVTA